MKFGIRVAMAAVAVAALAGCGGAKLGRDEAAAVVFGASGPAQKASSGGALALLQSGQGMGTATVSCTKGGTAKVSISTSGIAGEDAANWNGAFDIEYHGCVEPRADDPSTAEVESGEIVLDGKMTMAMDFDLSATRIEMKFRMQGRIDIGGDFSDYVDADITETILAEADSMGGGNSSVVINGTIKTSSESYTYNNETYAFSGT